MLSIGLCRPSCLIAFMFILGNVIFTFLMNRHPVVAEYKESLDETQKKVFDKIVDERRNLAMQGYGLGLALSIIGLIAMAFFKSSQNELIVFDICLVSYMYCYVDDICGPIFLLYVNA